MEKKTTHRIIGILVVIALIIILLPILFDGGSSKAPTQTAAVKAPPFPEQGTTILAQEQQTPTAAPAATATSLSTDTVNQDLGLQASNNSSSDVLLTPDKIEMINSEPSKDVTAENTIPSTPAPTNKDTNVTTASVTEKAVVKPTPDLSKQEQVATKIQTTETKSMASKDSSSLTTPSRPIGKTSVTKQVVKPKHSTKLAKAHSDVTKLKHTAWAIQMGSFKNKNNALNLANKLRASGFKAFTREFKSSHGDSIRVYVGPEFKQAQAATLNDQIQKSINMRGIVISYLPLEM